MMARKCWSAANLVAPVGVVCLALQCLQSFVFAPLAAVLEERIMGRSHS